MMVLDWRWQLLLTLALVCMPVVCASQVTEAPAAHMLSGQVVDSTTGQPIARALVRAGEHSALTDHEGRFAFDNARESAAVAMASKPGYFNEDIGSANEVGTLLLRLIPEAILYGTVTDTNSQPIQHLQVQLRRMQVRAGLAHWQSTQVTTTNAEGEFRFAELAEGKYSLSTGFQIDGLPDAASSLAFVPVLYPPQGPEGADTGLTLHAGDHVEANLNPAAEKLYPVSGVVNGASGRGVSFLVETREGLPVNPALHFFQDSGVFRLRLASGSYRLKVQSQTQTARFAGMREIAVGPAGLEGVSITLTTLPSIPVEMEYQRSDTRQPEAPAPTFLNLSLTGEAPGNEAAMLSAQPVDAGNGLHVPHAGDPLIIRDVEPAHYVLKAQIPPPWYVASATCGNVDLKSDLLVVSNGSGVCRVRVVLRDDSASLKWSLANQANPVAVMAFPLGNLTQDVDVSNASNGDGSNSSAMTGTINGLAPGRYLVIAAKHPLDVPYRDAEALEKYAPLGKEVTLAPNGEADVELELAAGEP